MASPVGEDSWLAYLDECVRTATDIEKRVGAVEEHKRAVNTEPGSLRLWLANCNYFWSLWSSSQSSGSGWSVDDCMMGRELFGFNTALELWSQGYEAIKYRISDSHVLWDRWVSLEMDLLSKTRTPEGFSTEGVKRITHLYRDRLVTPHLTWDETSQAFSSFLSEYNRDAWENAMKDATDNAQEAKRLIAARDPFELKIQQAARAGDVELQKALLVDYLEWEMRQSKRNNDNPEIGIDLCRGLYARALTDLFATDENCWHEYVVYVSSAYNDPHSAANILDILRRAVQHCPWSGQLWNRYILCAEEAKLSFTEIASIKHAATSDDQLFKTGMESMIEMYVAWCAFLKRTAMDAGAGDEAIDVADVGLPAALEDVSVVGKRQYGKDFQGDPKFRLERIYIQYLTEKKGAIDEARAQWNKLASIQMHADSHDFWFRYYMWEMLIFSSKPNTLRSPTPSSAAAGFRVPSLATSVLQRAVARHNIDWPEKVLEVYLQHCNDYEPPASVRRATDKVHKAAKETRRRREREQKEKEEAYNAYYAQQAEQSEQVAAQSEASSDAKRKRTDSQADGDPSTEVASKRQKNDSATTSAAPTTMQNPKLQEAEVKRDRENTTILVDNLPSDVTETKLRQFFREYGHINHVTALIRDEISQTSTALIEFKTHEEAQSALLKDAKFLGQSQLQVQPGHSLTLYVTNYPPAADEAYIRDLFKDCGEVLSIRLPNLAYNAHRRFCYISFRTRDGAAKAVMKKDGKMLEGKFKLVVKYSDPAQKKKREGTLAEGREVHVRNLDHDAPEVDVKEIFAKYGTVTRVNIPFKGVAYLDFETKEQAEKAVEELNNTKFMKRILNVSLSKESKTKLTAKSANDRVSASPAPSSTRDAEGDESMTDAKDRPTAGHVERTVALMGFPDTVNDARVRALVEPFGTFVKLTLVPAHGGAKIEYDDAGAAGKAQLRLNGIEFEGVKLRTGTLHELRQAKPVHKDDRIQYGSKHTKADSKKEAPASKMMVPPSLRRPATKIGPKRGLGFVPAKKTDAGEKTDEPTTNGTAAPKSNADFKAMFVKSREDAAGEEEANAQKADAADKSGKESAGGEEGQQP